MSVIGKKEALIIIVLVLTVTTLLQMIYNRCPPVRRAGDKIAGCVKRLVSIATSIVATQIAKIAVVIGCIREWCTIPAKSDRPEYIPKSRRLKSSAKIMKSGQSLHVHVDGLQ